MSIVRLVADVGVVVDEHAAAARQGVLVRLKVALSSAP
jgi:hypothetical protein